MRSLFSTVARYIPTSGRYPREDMLTQAFAATLERAPGIAAFLAKRWVDHEEGTKASSLAPKELDEVVPQLRLRPSGERIDLALSFDSFERVPGWLLWVEIKHQAHLSGDQQLSTYAEQLAKEPATEKRLVFLPPAGYVFNEKEAKPAGLIETSWQQVGELIKDWSDHNVTTWLVDEFLHHLGEEGLFVSDPVTTQSLEHLRAAESASAGLDALIDLAGREIDEWVGQNGELVATGDGDTWPRGARPRWPEFWRHYGRHEVAGGGGAWLEWNLRKPHASTFSNAAHFGAGVTLHAVDRKQVRLESLSCGLEWIDWDHGYPRVFSYLAAEEFFAREHASLSEQAEDLARWVAESLGAAQQAVRLPPRPQESSGIS